MIQAFHASIASRRAEVVERLRSRFGKAVVPHADIRIGFHRHAPIVIALVPRCLGEVIRQVEKHGGLPGAGCFVVDIEQRVQV